MLWDSLHQNGKEQHTEQDIMILNIQVSFTVNMYTSFLRIISFFLFFFFFLSFLFSLFSFSFISLFLLFLFFISSLLVIPKLIKDKKRLFLSSLYKIKSLKHLCSLSYEQCLYKIHEHVQPFCRELLLCDFFVCLIIYMQIFLMSDFSKLHL